MLQKYRTRLLQDAHHAEIQRFLSDPDFTQTESLSKRHGEIGQWLDPKLRKKVLEVGCGPGKYAAMLAALGFEVTAFDPHEFPEWETIRGAYPVEFTSKIFAEELPYDDQSFDHICCFGTLLYVDDALKSLQEMHRVLKPGGRIALRTVNSGNNFTRKTGNKLDPASNNLYTLRELEFELVEASFEIERSFSFGYWPSRWTHTYWFLHAVVFSPSVVEFLDRRLPVDRKHNHVVHAYRK